MNCAQRLIYNGLNAGRTAALIASSVLAANRTISSLPAYRAGSAALALTGAYTGVADATFDVEIVDATPTTPIISQPLLTGVGNGTLTGISFAGAAQKFTVELVDAGLPTLFASVAFAGVNIVARASGAAGNGIEITVDSSGLTYTPLPFSLIAPLPKDTRKSDAVGLDFNAAVMAADNQFPLTAKRITFGPDKTQVYRQAKKWTGAKWGYIFEPALQAYQPAGTRLSEVSGTYEVTVKQGATTEVFSGIKTNYDLLIALNTLSALVRIDGIIANDRAADGQAAGDLSMRTDAYAFPAVGSGSVAAQNMLLQDVVIDAAAPTEIIELKCWASTSRDSPNAHLGAEIWSVKGSVTGDVGNFKTGDTISPASGEWSLVIPAVYPVGYGDARGEFSVRSIDMVSRTAPAEPPPICVVGMALGPDAVDQTVTLTYTRRPTGNCACDDLPAPDLSNSDCLMGPNNPNSPGASSVSYPSTITARMTALWAFRATLIKSKTSDNFRDAALTADVLATLTGLGGSPVQGAEKTIVRESDTAEFAHIAAMCAIMEKTAIAVAAVPAALTLWDTEYTDMTDHLTVFATPGYDVAGVAHSTIIFEERIAANCDAILALAGISPLGKSDASTVSDDGCWQDIGSEAYYWAIDGSTRGAYLPAFNNVPYFSSRTVAGHNAATHEFAFQLNIKCPEKLKTGDRITLAVGNAGWSPTYQVGDTVAVSLVAASPQTLAGGQDGNADQTWHVSGNVHGPFAVFTATAGSGVYSNDGLAFTLAQGAIAFEKGAGFTFDAEGGHWRWRQNGGSWNGPFDITVAPVALSDGISATFAPGVAPSFKAADLYKFAVRQPNAPANVQAPTPFAWRWTGASATLDIDMGSATAFDAIAIARHTLPVGATVTITAGTTQGATNVLTATVLPLHTGTLAKLWDTALSARWVRIALANATGGSIGWVTVGQAFRPSLSAEVSMTRDYVMDRGSGINPSATLLGKGRGGSMTWTEGSISEADYTALVGMLDWVKNNGDEPILFFPSPTREADSLIAKIAADSTELNDLTDWRAMDTVDRRFQAQIGLAAIMQ